MQRFTTTIIIALLMCGALSAQTIQFNETFSQGMVLQREMEIAIWGTAQPHSNVSVEIQDHIISTQTDTNGQWNLQMPPLKAGGPFTLSAASGKERININEVYVGEVWLAGGQSNMGFILANNIDAEIHIAGATNKNIRFLNVPQKYYPTHITKEPMQWLTATSENVGKMSGVAYFFAQRLQQSLGIPVGIIGCYKGGTPAEAWMSRSTLLSEERHRPIVQKYDKMMTEKGDEAADKEFANYSAQLRSYHAAIKAGNKEAKRPTEPMGPYNPKRPFGLYENMLQRIMPFTTRGTIWYQGEANAARSEQYQTLFPALIEEWRADFKNPHMYFYFVQLSNYDHPGYNYPAWAEMREAQALTAQSVQRTAMAISIDYGEKNDIHPREKSEVGRRLAGLAMNNVYGIKNRCMAPRLRSSERHANTFVLTFDNGGAPLSVKNNEELKGFVICGTDMRFVEAKARIENDKVEVWADSVASPIAVRYGWANWSEGNLFNSNGMPAEPFRTDKEPLLTQGRR